MRSRLFFVVRARGSRAHSADDMTLLNWWVPDCTTAIAVGDSVVDGIPATEYRLVMLSDGVVCYLPSACLESL